MHDDLMRLFAKIKLVILDVDGVLTQGQLHFDKNGINSLSFDVKDGHGIRLLLHHRIQVAILSGRESEIVSKRMAELGVEHVYQGSREKGAAFECLLRDCDVTAEHVAYMGDDLPDIAAMRRAGLACAVSDAHPEVIRCADWVARSAGGRGGVRELCDVLLKAQGRWQDVIDHCSA